MANNHFSFKQFTIWQEDCAMKVSTDACTFGAWIAKQIGKPQSLLDIGAGTGLLSLMVAQQVQTDIDAIEIERRCYRQLCSNMQASPWKQYLNTIQGDILTYSPAKQYDTIICNPPFYEKQLTSPDTAINLARHASELTLPALLEQVDRLLKPEGNLYLLMPYYRKKECMEVFLAGGFSAQVVCSLKHSHTHNPFRVMFLFSRKNNTLREETIAIYEAPHRYTDQFISLMRAYYLYL